MPRAAAFFDLDGTLLTVNSAGLWARRERRLGRLGAADVARAAFYLGAYKLGAVDMERALRAALRTLRGKDEAWVRAETLVWWSQEVRRHIAPGAPAAIAVHRAAGEPVVLLTSSSRYAAEMVQQDLGIEHLLFQAYAVEDGRFTGEPVQPLCFGAGKVTVAERWAAEHGIDLAHSTFYSDSFTDLPMLQRVGHPRVVGPDVRLARHARANGWPVVDWTGDSASA